MILWEIYHAKLWNWSVTIAPTDYEFTFDTSAIHSADSRFAPSQWETAFLCNNISHWLGPNLETALYSSNLNQLFIRSDMNTPHGIPLAYNHCIYYDKLGVLISDMIIADQCIIMVGDCWYGTDDIPKTQKNVHCKIRQPSHESSLHLESW